ncbi:MAG TPA: NPCBM/NEW2 domain-containing protein [Gemmataceae bacterium]|nr:NPCBM/NEW2 domain-containing protein [Gemmataceae bacterium]
MQAPALILVLIVCAADPRPEFELKAIGGDPVTGILTIVKADGTVALAGDKVTAAGDWYSLRRVGTVLPHWPKGAHAEFNNGDRVRGTVAGADGDNLRLNFSGPGAVDQLIQFPLSSLRAVWFRNRADETDPAWLAAPRKRDAILSRNSDMTLGAFISIDGGKSQLRFDVDGKAREMSLSKLAAIGFNPDLARIRRPKGPYYRLTLADGTRLSAASIAFDGRVWTAETLFKESIKIPADRLISVDMEQGKAVYLSSLKPTKYEYRSFDGEDQLWIADRSVAGQAIRLKTTDGESTFDRGIGLHAECAIHYALGGKYRKFEALAGLDARSGLRGDAELGISVDGKSVELQKGGRLTHSGGPLTIHIDVTGAKELTIAVRKGNGGIVQDHIDLAEAILVP